MTKNEALRLALEALENHCGNYKLNDAGCARWNKAVDAIKEALAQPAWVSLTEEDKDSLLLPFGSYWVIDAIEAKLKENNGV